MPSLRTLTFYGTLAIRSYRRHIPRWCAGLPAWLRTGTLPPEATHAKGGRRLVHIHIVNRRNVQLFLFIANGALKVEEEADGDV